MKGLLEITVGRALRERAAKSRDKEFIVFPNLGIRHTFGDIDTRADAFAKGLLAAGLRKGDHVGIWAHNVPDWGTIFYAAARVGIITVPINVNCKHREIAYILGHADINALFFVDSFRNTDLAEILYQVIPELKKSSAGKLKSAQFPCLTTIASMGVRRHEGMYTLEDIVKMGNTANDEALKNAEAAVNNTDTAVIMYTSGTTGFPKGAMLSHRSLLNSAYYVFRRELMPDESGIVLNTLPDFYISSFSEAILGALLFGYKVVEFELFDPVLCLELIQKEKCSWIFGVPSVFMALMGNPRFNEFDLQSLRHICIGGTNCPAELLKNILVRMKLKSLYHGYGLTETSPFISSILISDLSDPLIGTIGFPLPGMEVSIRDSGNNECPVNVEGEICVRGFGVMQGYYKMEDATKEIIDADGWLHTGDLGRLHESGCLIIGGRLKELIIRGGENIYPKEVENLLLGIPVVHDAQVAGIPSEKYGEEVAAFIILKPGQTAGEKDIIDFCREKISFFKAPQYVFFVESFPLSGNGKVQKFMLGKMGLQMLKENGISL